MSSTGILIWAIVVVNPTTEQIKENEYAIQKAALHAWLDDNANNLQSAPKQVAS